MFFPILIPGPSNSGRKRRRKENKEQNQRRNKKIKKEGREANTGNHASFSYSQNSSEIRGHAGTEAAAAAYSPTAKNTMKLKRHRHGNQDPFFAGII